jgi:hypothetical protein
MQTNTLLEAKAVVQESTGPQKQAKTTPGTSKTNIPEADNAQAKPAKKKKAKNQGNTEVPTMTEDPSANDGKIREGGKTGAKEKAGMKEKAGSKEKAGKATGGKAKGGKATGGKANGTTGESADTEVDQGSAEQTVRDGVHPDALISHNNSKVPLVAGIGMFILLAYLNSSISEFCSR